MSDTTIFSRLKGTNKWQCYECEYTAESDVESDSWYPRLPFSFNRCPKCGRKITKFVYNSGHFVEPDVKHMMPDGVEWPIIDGKPVLPSDKLYSFDGESYEVSCVFYTGDAWGIEMVDDGSYWTTREENKRFNINRLCRKKPYHTDLNGMKISVGDTVYYKGTKLIVLELRLKEIKCCFADKKDIVIYVNSKKLTHQAPSDTWERLEWDIASFDSIHYWGCKGKDCNSCCPAKIDGKTPDVHYNVTDCDTAMAKDIVRRAKAIAAKEKEE